MTLQFKGVVEGYVTNFLAKNYWRVSRTMEWEDAMQEARLIFHDVSQRYPDVEDKHLMALFKTSWYHQFTDLSNKDTKQRHVISHSALAVDDEDSYSPQVEAMGESDNAGLLVLMVEQAPSEVRMVLSLFLSAPQELLDLALGSLCSPARSRDAGLKKINQCLGLPEDFDAVQAVENYFTNN